MRSGTDWEKRYQSDDTPWEKGEPSPGLVDFLKQRPGPQKVKTVCVPGCGTGHDVRAWAAAGFSATGLDLAPSAIRLARAKTKAARLDALFLRKNFLTSDPPRRFDLLFEHTLFCAIDPAARELYVQAVRRWLKPAGHFLAVFYLIKDKDGPPFGATRDELCQRFLPYFELTGEWVPRSYPNRKGLELMMWWRKRRRGQGATPPSKR